MNARTLAEAFRAQFAADAAFNAATPPIGCYVGQTADDIARPRLVFDATVQALVASGLAFTYVLNVWIESSSDKAAEDDPDPADDHEARIDLVRTKLLGTGKAALLTALNTANVFDFRGWGASTSDPAIETHHFKTPLVISGTALVV